jgi:hypothetical protein
MSKHAAHGGYRGKVHGWLWRTTPHHTTPHHTQNREPEGATDRAEAREGRRRGHGCPAGREASQLAASK